MSIPVIFYVCKKLGCLISDNTLDFMNSIHKDYLHVSIAGKDTTTELLRGRPGGGVSILYKKSLSESIVGIKSTNRRVCGVKITSNGNYNVYLPCDDYSNTTVTQGFIDCVEYIENLYNLSDCSSYICCGDFNTSFERNNAQSCYLTDFIGRNSLCTSWDHVSALKDIIMLIIHCNINLVLIILLLLKIFLTLLLVYGII